MVRASDLSLQASLLVEFPKQAIRETVYTLPGKRPVATHIRVLYSQIASSEVSLTTLYSKRVLEFARGRYLHVMLAVVRFAKMSIGGSEQG